MIENVNAWRDVALEWYNSLSQTEQYGVMGAGGVVALLLLIMILRGLFGSKKKPAPTTESVMTTRERRSMTAPPEDIASEAPPAPPEADNPAVEIVNPVPQPAVEPVDAQESNTEPAPEPLSEAEERQKLEEAFASVGSPPSETQGDDDLDSLFDEIDPEDLEEFSADDAEQVSEAPASVLHNGNGALKEMPEEFLKSDEEDDAAFEAALEELKPETNTAPGRGDDSNVTDISDALASAKETAPEPDFVDVSVFTPKRVKPAEAFILQAIFHAEAQAGEAVATAAAIDPDAEKRLQKSLRQAVYHGQTITASLDIPNAQIDQPVQAVQWRGDIEPMQFIVTIPAQDGVVSSLAKLQIAVDGVPVASAVWRIVLADDANVATEVGEYIPIQRYRRAFVSYSSQDRVEVLKRVQGLQAAGLEVFQDVLDLEPGDRWSKELYKHIDNADSFYLFWSNNAAKSEWVAKEWRYALERSMTHPDKRPDICPVILTAPPPLPPTELADRHFNDILAYVLKAHEDQSNG